MVLAFALIFVLNGEVQAESTSYWASVYTCGKYARALEWNMTSPRDRGSRYKQVNITAYCKPVWVNKSANILK